MLTPWHDRYIRQDKSCSSPPQNCPYNQNIRDRNTIIQPKLPSLARDTFGYIKRENYKMHEDLRIDIDASNIFLIDCAGQLNKWEHQI